MSNSSRTRRITAPWRKVCAALPAVALLGAGIAVSAPAALGRNIHGVAVSSGSPVVVVPDTALNLPAPAGVSDLPAAVPEAPAPGGAALATSSRVSLDSTGIPVRALEGYRKAATLVGSADRACHIDWALLAAIGRVESNHARFGGNQLDAAGVAQPGIIGIPLDGTNGTARITDSDGGRLDRDTVYDRAVGPMQFIPSTWQVVGVDADRDGVKNPQSMTDSASTAGIYLCSGPGDLSNPGDLHAAIMRYNASDSYVQMVTALAATYRLGVSALPSTEPTLVTAPSATTAGPPILATTLGQKAAATGAPMPPSTSVPAVTIVGTPVPTVTTDPTPTATATPTPTTDPTVVPDPTPTATATVPTPTATATDPTPTPTL
jgi:membrane-bound lytic murein transglycosylase B